MKTRWVIGIVMAAGLRAQSPDCKVDVYILAGALVPAGMLGNAGKKATQMFRDIGVTLRVRNRVPAREPSDGCGAPIVVQMEDGTGYQGHAEAMAYAKPYKKSGTCIYVFIDRVVRLNRQPGFAGILLAHVMAHEISHVLEGIRRHSEQGLMKAAWSEQDYTDMHDHSLAFAAEDVRLIHDGLSRRIFRAAED